MTNHIESLPNKLLLYGLQAVVLLEHFPGYIERKCVRIDDTLPTSKDKSVLVANVGSSSMSPDSKMRCLNFSDAI